MIILTKTVSCNSSFVSRKRKGEEEKEKVIDTGGTTLRRQLWWYHFMALVKAGRTALWHYLRRCHLWAPCDRKHTQTCICLCFGIGTHVDFSTWHQVASRPSLMWFLHPGSESKLSHDHGRNHIPSGRDNKGLLSIWQALSKVYMI